MTLTDNPIAAISVPWSEDSLFAAESLAEATLLSLPPLSLAARTALRIGIVELLRLSCGFRPASAQSRICTMRIRQATAREDGLVLELHVGARLFLLNNLLPPFSPREVGYQQFVGGICGCELVGTIASPSRVLLDVQMDDSPLAPDEIFDNVELRTVRPTVIAAYAASIYWGTMEVEWQPEEGSSVFRLRDCRIVPTELSSPIRSPERRSKADDAPAPSLSIAP